MADNREEPLISDSIHPSSGLRFKSKTSLERQWVVEVDYSMLDTITFTLRALMEVIKAGG